MYIHKGTSFKKNNNPQFNVKIILVKIQSSLKTLKYIIKKRNLDGSIFKSNGSQILWF